MQLQQSRNYEQLGLYKDQHCYRVLTPRGQKKSFNF